MPRGGKRSGAGRPKGSGKFGEPTEVVRIPCSQLEKIKSWVQEKKAVFPLVLSTVSAGFPSPADNEIERELDLNELLIQHPAATFFVRVSGTSMIKAGIHHNDLLVVDRSLGPSHGKIVIAIIQGEFTVKRLYHQGKEIQLLAENDDYSPIKVEEASDLRIWGVVTHVIHSL